MSRNTIVGIALSALSILLCVAWPSAGAAELPEELEPEEHERLENDRAMYRVTQIISIGGVVLGVGTTGLGTWGIVRGLQPCPEPDPEDEINTCRSDRTLALMLGGTGAVFGLGITGVSLVGLVASNRNLKRVNRKLSIRLVPLRGGGLAGLRWQFK